MSNAIAQIVKSAPVAAAIVKADKKVSKPRTTRAAQKPVAKVESIVAKSAKVIGVKYQIVIGRPSAGRPLKAYTQAALELLGMLNGTAHDRATLNKVLGATAVNYHLTNTMAFSMTNDGIVVTPSYGTDFFGHRADMKEFDPQDVEDFKTILVSGKPDGRLVKSVNSIKAM